MARELDEVRIIHVVLRTLTSILVWGLAIALPISLTVAEGHSEDSGPESFPSAEQTDSHDSTQVKRLRSSELGGPRRIRTCALLAHQLDPDRGALTGTVVDPFTGETLWSRSGDKLVAPASVQKLVTATAAWNALGAEFRFVTRVQATPDGNMWIVGGGDPTLTRSPGNNYYASNASVSLLVDKALGGMSQAGYAPPRVIHIDTSRYMAFPQWDESWRVRAWALGYVAPVSSLLVDGDRDNPALRLAARSTSPAKRAQAWFAEELRFQGATSVSLGGDSRAEGQEVARVESAPLPELLRIMLEDSDNSLAEALAREVALASGTTDLNEALVHALGVSEVEQEVLFLRDGSGLSPLNQLPASLVVRVLGEWVTTPELAPLLDSLAIAGETGSLQRRFGGDSSARGIVRAKTGSIAGVRSLAGVFNDREGNPIVFALNVSGPRVSDRDRDSLDALTEAIYDCGENLAHWEKADVSTTE